MTEWFQTTVGVRQGCVISPQLFNILLEVVMLYATHNVNIGANIQGQLISNLRFADDIVILAESANDLQNLVDKVYENISNLGLKINIAKTEVQVIGKKENHIKININGTTLKQVENFIYLGGTISQKGGCTEDIKSRIGKALGAVQRLQPIWKAEDIQQDTEVELYRVLVPSILLNGAETWTLKKEDENRLLVFEMMCLRKIMGVSRLDEIRNTKIRQSLGLKYKVIDKVTQKRMRFFGHIKRMSQGRYPKLLLEARLEGRRPKGRPAKRWMDCTRQDIQIGGMRSVTEAGRMAMDRKAWQNIMDQMARQSEEDAPVPRGGLGSQTGSG